MNVLNVPAVLVDTQRWREGHCLSKVSRPRTQQSDPCESSNGVQRANQ